MTAEELSNTIDDGLNEAPIADADTLTLAARYSELCDRLRDAVNKSDEIGEQIRLLQPVLLQRMQESGTQSVRAGNNTIYVRQNTYVSKRGNVETSAVVAALREHGMGYLVSEGYSAASLRGRIVELTADGQELPPDLAALLNVGTETRLMHRK